MGYIKKGDNTMADQEYPDMRDADVALAYFVNEELTEAWVPVFNAMCKRGNPVTPEGLESFKVFKAEIDAGTVMEEVEVEGEKFLVTATLMSVIRVITLLDRHYTVPIIKDLLLKKRCPLDFHEYNPKPVEVDNE